MVAMQCMSRILAAASYSTACNVSPVWVLMSMQVVPNRAVFLRRMDSHMAACNSMAMQLAGISRDTVEPYGGVIDRDQHGLPTGVFRYSIVSFSRLSGHAGMLTMHGLDYCHTPCLPTWESLQSFTIKQLSATHIRHA